MVDLSQNQPQKQKPTSNAPASDKPPVTQPDEPSVIPTPGELNKPSGDISTPPIKDEEKIDSPEQEEIKKELSELGISPGGSSKKTKVLLAALGVLFLVATLPAAVYLVKQRQEIRKEASVGTREHCTSPKCTVSVGPDNIAFKIKGHGTRNTSTPTVDLNIPAGSTMYKAYVIWAGDRQANIAKDKTFSLKVNNNSSQQVTAEADYSGYVEQYDVKVDSFLADITSLLPPNPTNFTFKVTGGLMERYIDDGGGGGGHGISFIVIYKNPSNPYNKIVIKLWGEFVMRNVSANMAFNINNRKSGSDKLRAAFFFGEGEGSMVGATRPNALYYNEDNNKRLNPTDGTDFPAWGSDPGHWWDTRITGGNLPVISALGNTATFHAQSYPPVRNEQGLLGDSIMWSGGIVEYEMEAPTPLGCWDECSQQSDCDTAGLTCDTPLGDTQRCINSDCPSEQTCVCPITACLDLTSTPSAETLEEESEAQFTCKGSSGVDEPINHVEFRLQIDEGSWIDLGTTLATKTNGEYEGSISYDVPQTGSYRVECRVCTSEDNTECTQWGEAE